MSVTCTAQPSEPAQETCNGRDDNCGTIDEGFINTGTACTIGEGACRSVGVRVCTADGTDVVCNAEVIEPIDEVCNDLDDDCDGQTDEDFEELDTACSIGDGICRTGGVRRCSEDGLGTICTAELVMPGMETCNGLDDDCDGRTDEDYLTVNTLLDWAVPSSRRHQCVSCRWSRRRV